MLPALSVVLGLVLLGAAALAGQPLDGLYVLGAMTEVGLGVALLEGQRADLAAPGSVEQQATAIAGVALLLAIMSAFVFEIAQGHGGAPYSWLAALGGSAYLISILVLRGQR